MKNGVLTIKPNQLDPYQAEEYDTQPVAIRLTLASGSSVELNESLRVLTPHLALRRHGMVFIARGTVGNTRLYRELPILDLDGTSHVVLSSQCIADYRAAHAEWLAALAEEPCTQQKYIPTSQRLIKAISDRAKAEALLLTEVLK